MIGTDFWIDLILVVMLSVIIAQNIGLRERVKELEAKLDRD